MNNKKYNTLSIVGASTCLFFPLIGLITSYIAKDQISETKEKGIKLASIGMTISIINAVIRVILIILVLSFMASDQSFNEEYKCNHASSCTYDSYSNKYTCTYMNKREGVEEYIICNQDINKPEVEFNDSIDTTKDDPDYDDTFDYDKETDIEQE